MHRQLRALPARSPAQRYLDLLAPADAAGPRSRNRRIVADGPATPPALLEVNDLRVTLPTARGPAEALRGVSFALERGETLGLIGESGCGKSMTALALMGLLPERRARQRLDPLRRPASCVGLDDAAMCRAARRAASAWCSRSR